MYESISFKELEMLKKKIAAYYDACTNVRVKPTGRVDTWYITYPDQKFLVVEFDVAFNNSEGWPGADTVSYSVYDLEHGLPLGAALDYLDEEL